MMSFPRLPFYAAKVKNPLCSDDLTLAQALAIPEGVSEWKTSIRTEFTSLIDKRNISKL